MSHFLSFSYKVVWFQWMWFLIVDLKNVWANNQKVNFPKNINEDIDFFKVGESDMFFWVKPKMDSFK